MKAEVDVKQVQMTVKERNRFYKALSEIRDIATVSDGILDNETKVKFEQIISKCDQALKGVI